MQWLWTAILVCPLITNTALAAENPVRALESSFADLVAEGWEPILPVNSDEIMMQRGEDFAICWIRSP